MKFTNSDLSIVLFPWAKIFSAVVLPENNYVMGISVNLFWVAEMILPPSTRYNKFLLYRFIVFVDLFYTLKKYEDHFSLSIIVKYM